MGITPTPSCCLACCLDYALIVGADSLCAAQCLSVQIHGVVSIDPLGLGIMTVSFIRGGYSNVAYKPTRHPKDHTHHDCVNARAPRTYAQTCG